MATKIFIILFSLTIISIKLASTNSVKEQIGLNDPQKCVTINGNILYYKHPYTTKETCINKTPTTPDKITNHLNIAYQGQLMYHNRSCPDKAACGFSCGIPYHAAVGAAVWVTPGKYKPSCLPDKHFMRDEAACINKCVKVERGNKK
uniref:Secreted protein n=1 Tax=Meloidogyne javanica TaxID=6303 RepID=A0A915LWW9_MELJA